MATEIQQQEAAKPAFVWHEPTPGNYVPQPKKPAARLDERDYIKFFGKYGMLKKDWYNMLMMMLMPIWMINVIGAIILPRDANSLFYLGTAIFGIAFVLTLALRWKYLKDYNERKTVKGTEANKN